ncbi:hypothetical protein [Zavarzinella formosa]|uniref:hypothetical protein n=1 Tax=Zavarzinella formosa TaxID=360055 RepID=UPI0007C4CCD4|nr:hypothetical protein [Zavarzinella formosa]
MNLFRAIFALVPALLIVLAAGCGNGGERRVAVSGKVIFKGQELNEGSIRFVPADQGGKSMGGASISSGAFAISADLGLLPGKYRVEISAAGSGAKVDEFPGGGKVYPELIPKKYNANSVLIADVTADGPNVFEFKLD